MRFYTHPYKRGFSFGVDYEGFLHFWCLIWRWELSWWPAWFKNERYALNVLTKEVRKREEFVKNETQRLHEIELEYIYSTRL